MLLTGEHRRERSAEGQWRGADLPGLQMMTMLMTLVLIGMMIKDCGKVQICIYIYMCYILFRVFFQKYRVFFLTGAPLKVLSVRLHLCTIVNPIKKVLSVRIYLPKKNFFRGAPVKKNTLYQCCIIYTTKKPFYRL